MLCYVVFAASYTFAFLSLQGSEVEPRCNISNPKPPQTTKQGDTIRYIFTHKYTCWNIVYSLWKICSWVAFSSLPERKVRKTALLAVTVYWVLLWERPKVQAMANTGKCLCLREGKWVDLYIPTQYKDILLTTDAWIWPRQQIQSLIT